MVVDTSVNQIINEQYIFWLISNLLLKIIRNKIIGAVGGIFWVTEDHYVNTSDLPLHWIPVFQQIEDFYSQLFIYFKRFHNMQRKK